MGSQSRRASESVASVRLPFTRTTSDVSITQKEQERIRRASNVGIEQRQQKFTVHAASPIVKSNRYNRRSPSPRTSVCKSNSLPSQDAHKADQGSKFTRWLPTFQPSGGPRALKCFEEANTTPPISALSLSELEVNCVISNPKLRHDINFDRELHFRPNLDGERGRKKLELADRFWLALETELEKYRFLLADPQGEAFRYSHEWMAEFRRSQRRMPRLFSTIKDILISLTPDQEIPGADEAMDVQLIMQQIERGVYDLTGLANWLATLLKAHCAPMRDQWVERMLECVEGGAKTFDAKLIVDGLKELFGIMEAMKLDIANHQIRYFRPVLLESTVRFEQEYYTNRIAESQIDTMAALTWFRSVHSSSSPNRTPLANPSSTDHFHTFAHAFISSILSPCPSLPETFTLDLDRLLVLRCDLHALIYTSLAVSALSQVLRLHSCPLAHATRAITYLRTSLPAIIGRGATDSRWAAKAGNVAMEIVRAAFGDFPGEGKGEADGGVGSRPDAESSRALCAELEAHLTRVLRPGSAAFVERVEELRGRLIAWVTGEGQRFEEVGTREVGEALLAPLKMGATAVMPLGRAPRKERQVVEKEAVVGSVRVGGDVDAAFEDVSRRLTHIAVLHWRVWAPLVYLQEELCEEEDEDDDDDDQDDEGCMDEEQS